MAQLVQGLYGTEFYNLIDGSLRDKGIRSLQSFIAINPRYWFDEEGWKTIYRLADRENPERIFQQKIGNEYVPVMATYLSEDAETPLIGNEGYEIQTGDIPRMGKGYAFSAKAYEDLLKLQRQGINVNEDVYKLLVNDVRKLFQSVHSQRTFTGFQIESTGQYVTTALNNSGGIKNLKIDAHVPTNNKKACGGYWFDEHKKGTKNAWSSSSASPIGDLEDMFYYAYHNHVLGINPAESVFRMGRTAYDTLKNHANTKLKVAMWKTGNLIDSANLQYFEVVDADLAAYIAAKGLPKIEVVDYYGFTEYLNTTTMKLDKKEMAAFDANTVLLRYAGDFGEIQWAKVSNIFATAVSPVMYSEGGAIAVQQDEGAKGVRFNCESLCVPVPYAIQRCLYLKINEAAS